MLFVCELLAIECGGKGVFTLSVSDLDGKIFSEQLGTVVKASLIGVGYKLSVSALAAKNY